MKSEIVQTENGIGNKWIQMNKANLQYADPESDGVFAWRKELENKSSNPNSCSEER